MFSKVPQLAYPVLGDSVHKGLCEPRNCHMLTGAHRLCNRVAWVVGTISKGPPPAPGNMQRLAAKLLVLVLLAGVCAPFAAAAPMQAAGAHCARKPLRADPVDEVPSCHHHPAAGQPGQPSTKENSSAQSVRSNQCCNDHECCRSAIRSLWAQPLLNAQVRIFAQAEAMLAPLQPQVQSFELASHYPARAPPAL